MGAVIRQDAHMSGAVAEGDQILAEKPKTKRASIRLRQLGRQEARKPVLSHEFPNGRTGANLAEQRILFPGKHGWFSFDFLRRFDPTIQRVCTGG
jgi:hypothetical protein